MKAVFGAVVLTVLAFGSFLYHGGGDVLHQTTNSVAEALTSPVETSLDGAFADVTSEIEQGIQ